MKKDLDEKKTKNSCECNKECDNRKYYIKVFVATLVLIVVFFVGFIIGSYLLYNDFKEEIDGKETEYKCNDQSNNENKNEVNEENEVYVGDFEKIKMRIEDLGRIEQVSRNINSVEDFTNQELLLFALDYLGYSDVHTLEEINSVTQTYFGIDVEPENINCHFSTDELPLYLYDENKKAFVPNEEHGGHGLGSYYSYILNRIVKLEVKDNIYTVEVKKAFGRCQDVGPVTTFYKTYKDMDELKKPIIDFNGEKDEEFENYYPEVDFNSLDNDKLITYTYVFKKVDEEFILVSYTFG